MQGGCVPELTIPEAAAALGVSVDTIRRRIKAGELPARTDERGRYRVTVEDAPDWMMADAYRADATGIDAGEAERLRLELEHARELLDAERRHNETLRTQLEHAQHAQQRDAEERGELRRLLGNAQMQLAGLLPAPREAAAGASESDDTAFDGAPAGDAAARVQDGPQRRTWRRLWRL